MREAFPVDIMGVTFYVYGGAVGCSRVRKNGTLISSRGVSHAFFHAEQRSAAHFPQKYVFDSPNGQRRFMEACFTDFRRLTRLIGRKLR